MRALTYADQDGDRLRLSQICASAAAEILRLIDSFVGGDTLSDPEYRAFRERIGPEVVALLQADVVGPVVAGLDVGPDGRASVVLDTERLSSYQPPADIDPLLARTAWLCAEVPSMDAFYGQLYPPEKKRLAEIVRVARALDFERQQDRDQAEAMLLELEVMHLWAHPGGRLMRKDPASIAVFRERVAALAPLVAQADEKHRHMRAVLDGAETPKDPAEARQAAVQEIATLDAKQRALEEALEETRARRERVSAVLATINRRPAPALVCPQCNRAPSATPAGPVCFPCGWTP